MKLRELANFQEIFLIELLRRFTYVVYNIFIIKNASTFLEKFQNFSEKIYGTYNYIFRKIPIICWVNVIENYIAIR